MFSYSFCQLTYLRLLRRPVPVRVSIEHDLVGLHVAHFGGGVRQGALCLPLDLVAGRLGDEEGRAAALVAVAVDALLDREVEDLALSHG